MWKCKKCSEKIEDEFDVCWNCGANKDGAVSEKDVVEQIKIAKIEQKQERIEEENQFSIRNNLGNQVVIVDIQIPFISMVVLLVKSAFAAIPALFVVMFFIAIFLAIFGGFIGIGELLMR